MDTQLAQRAIAAALAGDWITAKEINLELLKSNPRDINALNRCARAHAETGNIEEAKKTAKKVLALDPFNTIAAKCLEKWENLKDGEAMKSVCIPQVSFLEEPGKTKIVSLIHLGDSKLIACLSPGEELKIDSHGHRVALNTDDGKFVGRIADDLSTHLKNLITYGNEYQAFVKYSNSKEVKVFLKETKRSSKLADIPSFNTERIDYISFTPPELVHDSGPEGEDSDSEE